MIQTLRQTWALLTPALRRRWLSLGPLAAISAAFEAIAVASVYVMIRLADDPAVADYSNFAGVIKTLFGADDTQLLAKFALLVAVLYLAKNALRLFVTYLRLKLQRDAVNSLSSHLMQRYVNAPYAYHLQHNSAELQQKVQETASSVGSTAVASATVIISEAMIVIALLVVVIRSAPGDALLVAAGFSALMALLLHFTQKQHLRWGETNYHLGIRNRRLLQESLNGIKEVKTLGLQSRVLKQYREQRTELSNIGLQRGMLEALPHILVETFLVLLLVALIWTLRAEPSYGERMLPLIALFGYAGLRLLPSLHWIVYHSNNLRFCAEQVAALHQDWKHLPEQENTHSSAKENMPGPKLLRLQNIQFQYDNAERQALANVTLDIHQGEHVAIVGATGAGKSTLLDIMLGLLPPTAGTFLVDDKPYAQWHAHWAQFTSLVPQHPFLIDDTVRANVATGITAQEVDDERIKKMLATTHLSEWLSKQAQGLDTDIGENGQRMSGGERQRLALARALYRGTPILFLDEPTSALDSNTEAAIAQAIESDNSERMIIMVTHRPALAKRFGRIIWLEGGRIRDQGSFDELSDRHPEFRERMSL